MRSAAQYFNGQGAYPCREAIAVVEQQEGAAVCEDLRDLAEKFALAAGRYRQCQAQRLQPLIGAAHRRQVEEPNAVGILICVGLSEGQRALGFAHAAGPKDSQRAAAIQQRIDLAQFMPATDQVVQRGRKTYRNGRRETRARLSQCRRLFDRAYIAVARAVYRLDEPRFLGIVDQRTSRQRNNAIKCRRCDVAMTPNGIQQLLPSQQFSRPHDQLRQHRENLWLEGVLRPASPEDAVRGIKLAVSAAVHDLIQAHSLRAVRQSLTNPSLLSKDCAWRKA